MFTEATAMAARVDTSMKKNPPPLTFFSATKAPSSEPPAIEMTSKAGVTFLDNSRVAGTENRSATATPDTRITETFPINAEDIDDETTSEYSEFLEQHRETAKPMTVARADTDFQVPPPFLGRLWLRTAEVTNPQLPSTKENSSVGETTLAEGETPPPTLKAGIVAIKGRITLFREKHIPRGRTPQAHT